MLPKSGTLMTKQFLRHDSICAVGEVSVMYIARNQLY